MMRGHRLLTREAPFRAATIRERMHKRFTTVCLITP
jgi:hypothetical protein